MRQLGRSLPVDLAIRKQLDLESIWLAELGGEILHGWQVLKNGSTGNAPRLQLSAKYSFVKVDQGQEIEGSRVLMPGERRRTRVKTTMQSRIDIFVPLLLGMFSFAGTTIIHALPLGATVNFIRREKNRGRVGAGFWIDVAIVARTISYAAAAHLIEVGWWALLFLLCGEFHEFGSAYYHSAVNYTTLGYGDIIMSTRWRLLGPLEAANGVLLFGVTAAMVFAVIQKLVETRFVDLRN